MAKAPPIATGRLLSLRLFSTPLIYLGFYLDCPTQGRCRGDLPPQVPQAARSQCRPPSREVFSICLSVSDRCQGRVAFELGYAEQPRCRTLLLEHSAVPTLVQVAAFSDFCFSARDARVPIGVYVLGLCRAYLTFPFRVVHFLTLLLRRHLLEVRPAPSGIASLSWISLACILRLLPRFS